MHHGVPRKRGEAWRSAIGCDADIRAPVFRNLLVADSGKGQVEDMVRILRDIPPCRQAKVTLLHVIPEQAGTDPEEHRARSQGVEIGRAHV